MRLMKSQGLGDRMRYSAVLSLVAWLWWGGWGSCVGQVATNANRNIEVERAIADGLFREVEGVVHDLRKPQPEWVRFANVKVIHTLAGRTVVNVAESPGPATLVMVRNLPEALKDGERISFVAKPVGPGAKGGSSDKPPRSYDAGVACKRTDIPTGLLAGSISSARKVNHH